MQLGVALLRLEHVEDPVAPVRQPLFLDALPAVVDVVVQGALGCLLGMGVMYTEEYGGKYSELAVHSHPS